MAAPIKNATRIHSQIDDFVTQQRADDGEQHADLAGQDAAAGGCGRVQPLDGKDDRERRERGRRNCQICPVIYGFRLGGSFLRNIFSMRSVIRNPLTMLMVAAT